VTASIAGETSTSVNRPFWQRPKWGALLVALCTVVCAAIATRYNVETLGDRRDVAAHLQMLKRRVEHDPQDTGALDEIRSILHGKWSFARTYSCGVLGELGTKARPAIPDLVEALNSGDGYVEREAALALGKVAVGDPRPVPALIDKLTQQRSDAAWFSAESLGNIGGPAVLAIPALERATASQSKPLRESAEEALSKLKAIQDAERRRSD
jgi:hypothetical protein